MTIDLSVLANWVGPIVGIVTLAIWMWKVLAHFRKHIAQIRQDALFREELALALANKTTNAERRADIYTYFTLRAIKTESRRQLAYFIYLGVGAFIVAGSFYAKSMGISPPGPDADWRVWILHVLFLLIVVAFGIVAWFDRVLRKLEDGWQAGVDKSLRGKLSQHTGAS